MAANEIKNKYWNLFLVFLAAPIINLGLSITFYLFLPILFRENSVGISKNSVFSKNVILFTLLGLTFVLSSLNIPEPIETTFSFRLITLIQHLYWVFISIFLIKNSNRIFKINTLRYLFIGFFLIVAVYYFQGILPSNPVLSLKISRNGFVYILLCFTPFWSAYIYQRWGRNKLKFFFLLLILIMLSTNGRAGGILIFFECLLLSLIYFPKYLKRISIISLLSLLIIGSIFTSAQSLEKTGIKLVGALSPRLSELLTGEGDAGDLDFDKSWMTRKLMIEKGREIFTNYPIFGIGPLNFTNYTANLTKFKRSKEFSRLSHRLIRNHSTDLNTTSPHNAYVQIISEYGIVGFLLISIIILKSYIAFFSNVFKGKLETLNFAHVSVITISIHFYTISNFTGTLTFFILGFSHAAIYYNKSLKKMEFQNVSQS